MRGKKVKQLRRLLAEHRKTFEDMGHKMPGNGLKHDPRDRRIFRHHPDSPRAMNRAARKRWGKGVPLPS